MGPRVIGGLTRRGFALREEIAKYQRPNDAEAANKSKTRRSHRLDVRWNAPRKE